MNATAHATPPFVQRIKGSTFKTVSIETLLPHVRKDAKTSRVSKAAAFWALYHNDQRQGYETADGRFIRDNNLSHVELTAPLVVFRNGQTTIMDGNHRILALQMLGYSHITIETYK